VAASEHQRTATNRRHEHVDVQLAGSHGKMNSMPTDLSPTPRSTIRKSERARRERSALYEVLDAGLLAHLGSSSTVHRWCYPRCSGASTTPSTYTGRPER